MEKKDVISESTCDLSMLDDAAWQKIETTFRKVFRRQIRMLPKDAVDKIVHNVKSSEPIEVAPVVGDMNMGFEEIVSLSIVLLKFVLFVYKYYFSQRGDTNVQIIVNYNEFQQKMKENNEWDDTFEELQEEFEEICNMFKESI